MSRDIAGTMHQYIFTSFTNCYDAYDTENSKMIKSILNEFDPTEVQRIQEALDVVNKKGIREDLMFISSNFNLDKPVQSR